MNLIKLLLGLNLFCIFIGLHIVIWRYCRPVRDYLILILISLIPFLIILSAIWLDLPNFKAICLIDWAFIFFLYFVLCGAYIAGYPAIQTISPTLKMVILVGSNMPIGLTYEQIRSDFSEDELLKMRIQDLLKSKFVIESNNLFKLTTKGIILIWLFVIIRKLLGLPMGRG